MPYMVAAAIFMSVITCFTLVVTVGVCSSCLAKGSSRDDSTFSYLAFFISIFAMIFLVYPSVFIAVDIMDARLCPQEALIMWIPGDIAGCNLPSSLVWQILLITNEILTLLIFPFAIAWLKFPKSDPLRRACTAIAATASVTAIYLLVAYGFHKLDDALAEPPAADILLSSKVSLNATRVRTSCPAGGVGSEYSYLWERMNASAPQYGGLCASDPDREEGFRPNMDRHAPYMEAVEAMFVFAGYLLFAPLAGLGFFLYPWGLILSFASQPRTPISKAEFLRRGRSLVTRAVQIKAVCGEIKQEIKLGNHSKGLRRRAAALRRQCLELEKDDHCLHRVFPSGDDPELVWSFRTLRNYGTLAWGIVAAAISTAWVANTVVYLLPGRPVSLGINVLIAFVRSASVGAYFLNVFDLLLLLVLLLHVQQCTYAGLQHAQELLRLGTMSAAYSEKVTVLSNLRNAWPLTALLQAQLQWVAHGLAGAVANTAFMEVTASERHAPILFNWMYDNAFFSWVLCLTFFCTAAVMPLRFFLRRRSRQGSAAFIPPMARG